MTLRPDDLAYVRHVIRRDTGVVLSEAKTYLIESRLRVRARAEGVASPADLVQRMRRPDAADLRHRLVEDILIGETQFFRDRHPFEAIESTILSELIDARGKERRLDLWCAACSSGQEPYSLAILLQQSQARLRGWTVRLLASDFSAAVLARAREGIFSEIEVERGLAEDLRDRHFQRTPDGWRLSAEIRKRVAFRQINLVHAWPGLPRMDLILLRNVMIYFDQTTRASILQRAYDLLRPGGYLLLGSAETMVDIDTKLESHRIGRSVIYRRPLSRN